MTAAPLYLVAQTGPAAGAVLALTAQRIVIGRDKAADLRLQDPLVSRAHARLERGPRAGTVVVTDLGSRNGTRVNGDLVDRREVTPGDEVRVGRTRLLVSRDAPPALAPEERAPDAALDAMAALARLATSATDPFESLDAFAALAAAACGARSAAVAVFEDGTRVPLMEAYAEARAPSGEAPTIATEAVGDAEGDVDPERPAPCAALLRALVETGRASLAPDAAARPDLSRDAEVAQGLVKSAAALPLRAGESLVGALRLYWAEAGLPPEAMARAEVASALSSLALSRALVDGGCAT